LIVDKYLHLANEVVQQDFIAWLQARISQRIPASANIRAAETRFCILERFFSGKGVIALQLLGQLLVLLGHFFNFLILNFDFVLELLNLPVLVPTFCALQALYKTDRVN